MLRPQQRGEHGRARPAVRQQRHEQERGREVREQVGEHGGEAPRSPAGAPNDVRVRQRGRSPGRPGSRSARAATTTPSAEHEDRERGVRRRAPRGIGRARRAAESPRRPSTTAAAPETPEGLDRRAASRTAKPTSISRRRPRGSLGTAVGPAPWSGPAVGSRARPRNSSRSSDVLDDERRPPAPEP